MGLPFLVFGWLMVLKFAAEASGKEFGAVITTLFLLLNFGVIIALGMLAGDKAYDEHPPDNKILLCRRCVPVFICGAPAYNKEGRLSSQHQ